MFGKLLKLTAIAVCATTAAASFTYSQMATFTRSTVVYLNNFQSIEGTCLASSPITQLQTTMNSVCSAAENINYFQVQQEPTQVANLFSFSSSMLGSMASSITMGCNANIIKTLLQEKSTQLANWSNQIQSGASVSLSQVSVVNDLKAMVSNLNMGLMSAAAYDLGESILYDM